VVNLLGNLEPFIPESPTLGKCAKLGMTPGQEGMGLHGEQKDGTEALTAPLPSEGHDGLLAAVDRPPIVALGIIGEAEDLVRLRLLNDIPTGGGECEGTLGGGDDLVMRAHVAEMACQSDRDLCEPTRVIEGHRQGLGLT
jgi:hypothetical protein